MCNKFSLNVKKNTPVYFINVFFKSLFLILYADLFKNVPAVLRENYINVFHKHTVAPLFYDIYTENSSLIKKSRWLF